ncbi:MULTISPECIES: NAD-dependent epimerase/dehydratase family protein [unclassified Brenneria]|uniref:NAD-dependent epimerase/dehydratase family protein n=1 Tax=unclassified Brenneria TaxID=2634434 RepID=UPI001551FCB7|nr:MULTISPECIES: NAD-dependent epimerase/dehydratase family protein [unclassified Brenneria]MBJ7221597.1 NAD-dependent epimerase/dehydratase family protein [Brenneria sp. L3-3C-1]MEE3642839.1 NAD-dependent epimerase/dehydratase family protein [Brenneria sp. L3_3C_1]MEE3650976.1 NAD-dependent epimerase/dehydratase family protein [Brenneria sp. HEZEL_4_2_4]NPD00931.1 NAD-dependent epimerase/dehydratase family protein [Brenneria sp. hezel4-2-4]
MSNHNVLISGGAGFIGSNLALALIKKGWNVTVLDNLSPQIHGDHSPLYESIKDKVTFIHGDVRSKDDWQKALKGQNCVVHLAAETGTGQSMYQIQQYTDVNVGGTGIFLDLLANEPHEVSKIVVASSRAIYGEGRYACDECGEVYPESRHADDMEKGDFEVKCPVCARNVEMLTTHEDSKIHPSSIYGITKQTQEQLVLAAGKALNIPAVAFRYQNVYGPGQSLSNPYTGILSIFSTRIRNGNDIFIFEDGKESRDFVYIDDVVNATIAGIENPVAAGHVFNVGAGVSTSVTHVANTLVQAYGSTAAVKTTGNFRVGDIRHNIADLNKIKAVLDFTPSVSFEQGIRKFVDWVMTQETQVDSYETSIQEMKEKGLYK